MVDCNWIRNRIPYEHLKIHYFVFNGALACVIPFLPVHANEIGISTAAIGVIYSCMPLVTMILKPIFGYVADHFNNVKLLMFIFLGAVMLSSSLTVNIPKKTVSLPSVVQCSSTGTNLTFKLLPSLDCAINASHTKPLKCFMRCSECVESRTVTSILDNLTHSVCEKRVTHPAEIAVHLLKPSDLSNHYVFAVKDFALSDRIMNTVCVQNIKFNCSAHCEPILQECYTGKEGPEYSSSQFCLFFLFGTVFISLSGVATSFTDAICFNELGSKAHLYGRQRLWGTIGWGLISPIAGFFNEYLGENSFLKSYQPGSLLLVVFLLYDIWITNSLVTQNMKLSQSVFKDVVKVLKQIKVIFFIISVLMIGAFTALIWSFLYIHLVSMSAGKIIMGLVPAVQCFLGELVFFFFSGQLIKKLGHFNILTINFACFALRFIAYSYLKNPWMVLPVELLQGPTYGLFWATMASFAHIAALPGTEVTIQGLVGSAFELGMAMGNLAGGFFMWKFQGARLFFVAGLISGAYCLVQLLFNIILLFQEKKAPTVVQEEAEPNANPNEEASFI